MADQSLADQIKSEIESMQTSVRDLQSSTRLTDIRDRVEDLGSSVSALKRRLQSLRKKGYAFEKDLEVKAKNFEGEWEGMKAGVQSRIEKEAGSLALYLRPLETQVAQLAGGGGPLPSLRPRLNKIKSEVELLEGRVEAAEKSIQGEFDQYSRGVEELKSHLYKLEWMMDELGEASFDLLATESGIMAVKAVWAKEGKQSKTDPEGVLYLTDQRIIFEHKEKVATKKVLFVATEKKLVQETLWQIPVVLVEEVKPSKQGFLNKDDYIKLSFSGKAPYDVLHLHIWQRGDEWQSLILRAKAREFDLGRAIPITEEVAARVKNAPTKCPSCGGAITQPILRGMENINCEFCGDVIRL